LGILGELVGVALDFMDQVFSSSVQVGIR